MHSKPLFLSLTIIALVAQAPEGRAQSARNAAYVEIGGSAIVPSLNYERRIGQRWAGRAGVSAVVSTNAEDETQTTFIFPLTASWLSHPAGHHHLELGGGITLVSGDRQDLYEIGGDDDDENYASAFASGIIGYRYQRPDGGFVFRAASTPVAGAGEVLPWLGISFGYAW